MSSTITSVLQALRLVPSPNEKTSLPISLNSKTLSQPNQLVANGLPIYSLQEVAMHDSFDDCWIVLYDRVYDVSKFLQIHPGGDYVIMDNAGRDATLAFHGTGHSKDAIEQLKDYLIGELPTKEWIFRNSSQCRVLSLGIPE